MATPFASPGELIEATRAQRPVIQDFQSLEQSIDWRLGSIFFQARGISAFSSTNDCVPFAINNTGHLSTVAAKLLRASLAQVDENGKSQQRIFVLELGIGSGLFARYFADALLDVQTSGDGIYDRLCYVAGDKSERILADILSKGILANHTSRFRLAHLDAVQVDKDLAGAIAKTGQHGRPFYAVFLNYVLDMLPIKILRVQDGLVSELFVRTCLARAVELRDHTHLTIAELSQLASSDDADANSKLLELYPLFALDCEFRPVDIRQIPYGDFAINFARKKGETYVVHSYGAIRCLEACSRLLAQGGFILMNDYPSPQATCADEFIHQKFSGSIAIGVNFPLLKAYFEEDEQCEWIEPHEDDSHISTRLLTRGVQSRARAVFHEHFGKAAAERLWEPPMRARKLLQIGRTEAALSVYKEALALQPKNWALMSEIAKLLIFTVRDYPAGVEMARTALTLNPTCCADLWNTLGDGLYCLKRVDEAREAFVRAIEVDARDVRARLNLAFVHEVYGEYDLALRAIADGLYLDL